MDKGIIVDLDGTLACMEWRRPYVTQKPKDWKSFLTSCGHDAVNPTLEKIVRGANDIDFKVLIVSGRPWDLSGVQTTKWLYENGIPHDHLIMRMERDYRPDTEVKDEMWHKLIKPLGLEIVRAFDDRPDIAEVWHSHGIPVTLVEAPDLDPVGAERVRR